MSAYTDANDRPQEANEAGREAEEDRLAARISDARLAEIVRYWDAGSHVSSAEMLTLFKELQRLRSAPGARAALNELHQMDQDMLGKPSPEPSGELGIPTGEDFAAVNNLAVTREWLRGWTACRQHMETLARSAPEPREEQLNKAARKIVAGAVSLRDHLSSCDKTMGDTHACTCGMWAYRRLLESLDSPETKDGKQP